VETRSAVSSSVSWLIWSTMPLILGLTASVELNRLVVAAARSACAETRAEETERSWRAQLCAAYRHDMAMFVDVNWKTGRLNSNLVARSQSRASSGKEDDCPQVFRALGPWWGLRPRLPLVRKFIRPSADCEPCSMGATALWAQ
jgi:hypothetical protein